jgi:hypothetical protein
MTCGTLGGWHFMSGTSLQELMELGRWKSYELSRYLTPEHLPSAERSKLGRS